MFPARKATSWYIPAAPLGDPGWEERGGGCVSLADWVGRDLTHPGAGLGSMETKQMKESLAIFRNDFHMFIGTNYFRISG